MIDLLNLFDQSTVLSHRVDESGIHFPHLYVGGDAVCILRIDLSHIKISHPNMVFLYPLGYDLFWI